MNVTVEGVVAAIGLILGVSTVAGLAVRMILLPYLRDNLVSPVHEVREQVANTHSENLRDDLDRKHAENQQSLAELKAQHDASNALLVQHLGWSGEETARLWAAIRALQKSE